MTTRTIIFDLDGTISDPFEGISKSINFALESTGFNAVDPERVRPLIGPPLTDIFEILVGDRALPHMPLLVDKYRERYASIGYAENVIYKHMPEVIAKLAGAGYELGVCTSKRVDYARKIVAMFGLAPHFRFVDGGDVGVHKSDQLRNLVAAGMNPTGAVMIGDRYVDIDAAKQNGMGSVAVAWGFGGNSELTAAEPDHLLEAPRDILGLFA